MPLAVNIPSEVLIEEDEVLKRCRLQADAAVLDTKHKRLRQSLMEWKKIAAESKEMIAKTQTLHQSVVQDTYAESIR